MKKKKALLAFKGAYGESNFGDDALQYYLWKWALENNWDAVFIGKKAAYVKLLFSDLKYISKMSEHRYIFEFLVLGGGTQFFTFKRLIESKPLLLRVLTEPLFYFSKFLYAIEKSFYKEENNYINLIALGIGLGPFQKRSYTKSLASDLVQNMSLVYPRDSVSLKFANKFSAQAFLGTDICFLPGIIDFSHYHQDEKNADRKKIGIILRDWNFDTGGAHYIDKLIKDINGNSRRKYDFEFLFFKHEPKSFSKIKNLSYPISEWNPLQEDVHGFLTRLSQFDLIISARFHGIIFSALLNIPSIAIEIEHKLNVTKEMLGRGVEIWKQPFEESLIDKIDSLDFKVMKENLAINVAKQGEIAENMFACLAKEIENSKSLE